MAAVILSIILIALMIPIGTFSVSAATVNSESVGFAIRNSAPVSGGAGWQYYCPPTNNYPLSPYNNGNCTWYAYGRAYEAWGTDPGLGSAGDAGNWYSWAANHGYSVGSTPKTGSIICWSNHVAFVENVSGDSVTFTESNYALYSGQYPRWNSYTTTHPWTYTSGFQGYIYLGNGGYNDTSAPTISNARAENMSANSFDILCELNDDVGVTRVWLNIYGPSGQNGYEVAASNGSFSHRISTQGYGGAGLYSVHIYAFDAAGHQTSAAVNNIQAINDTVAPTITNAKAINPSASEFTITCQLNDNVDVKRVYVIVYSPDGTQNNGYDVAASNGTFSHTIKTAQYGGAGVYKVHLYAFDSAGNQAPCAINNIEAVNDTTAPTITDAKAINVSGSEFTITCQLNDNVGVTRVYVIVYSPDGTQNNGYDVSATNGTFSHTIKTAQYGGLGVYKVHLYAFDAAGNQAPCAINNIVAKNDAIPPEITEAKASNMSASEFTISCQLNDNVGVTRVYVIVYSPDGTQNNGYNVSASNGTFTHTIKTAQYGGSGVYRVHLYAFDAEGNQAPCAINNIVAKNDAISPEITEAKAINTSASEFTISCRLNDNIGVTRVYVIVYNPDGTQNNGYDVSASNGVFTHTIKTENYAGEGVYKVHLYAFDAEGNQAPCAINNIFAYNHTLADTNLDGIVSISDVTTIQRYLTKAITFTDEQLAISDTNGDGKVDISDATYLQMYLAKYDVVLGEKTR